MEFEVTSTNGSNLNTVSPTVIKVVGCGGGGGNANPSGSSSSAFDYMTKGGNGASGLVAIRFHF